MLLTPFFFYLKNGLDKYKNIFTFKVIFTIIKLISPIYLCYIMIKYDKILFRCYFVLILCTYTFIISYDYGYLSYITSLKITKIIMSAQLEMYLIQLNINDTND